MGISTVSRGFWVYLLECADQTLYTGWTVDPAARLRAHNAGRGAKYTRVRLPVRMVYQEACPNKRSAMQREAAIKRLTRVQKLELIRQRACPDLAQKEE